MTDEVNKKIVRCIGVYEGHNTEILTILRRYWPILLADKDLYEVLNEYPTLTYRRGQNLREHLVHSLYQEEKKDMWLRSTIKGSFPCGNCKFCSFLLKIKEFKVPGMEKKIEIRQLFNFRSKDIVYVASCTCPKLYVGKTRQEFRHRISKHISTVNCREETPIARYIREYHNDDSNFGVYSKKNLERERETWTRCCCGRRPNGYIGWTP